MIPEQKDGDILDWLEKWGHDPAFPIWGINTHPKELGIGWHRREDYERVKDQPSDVYFFGETLREAVANAMHAEEEPTNDE